MRKMIALLLIATAACAADDSWKKVQDLKSGTEVRVFRKGAKQPLLAKFDDADEENLRVATKTEQLAIPKGDIDRLDARPAQTSSRVTKETRTNTTPENRPATPVPTQGAGGPGSSVSSNVSVGSKPDFETVYRRILGQPAK